MESEENYLKKKQGLKSAKSFCIFLLVFSGSFAFFVNPIFFIFPALSLTLTIFYENEMGRLEKSASIEAYSQGYYVRYSLTVNQTILGFGIIILCFGHISILSIAAIIWGASNVVYFHSKKKKNSNDGIIDTDF